MSRSVRLVVGACALLIVAGLAIAASAPDRAGPTDQPVSPSFRDITAASGIDQIYDGEFAFFVGGGVAAFDCDDDGLDDLYFAGGANPAALYRNRSEPGGDIGFVRHAAPVTDLEMVVGAYPMDIDGDGFADLAVLRHGENVLLRGLGDCRFERANEAWHFEGGAAWTTAFSATWESHDSWPTLATGNYLVLDDSGNQTGECWPNELHRPAAEGYQAPQELTPAHCTLSMLFSDWNRTGTADLRISNDRQYYRDGGEQLWRFSAGEQLQLYGSEDGWNDLEIFGMGIASHDVTGDGYPEVFLTSMGDNKLQTLSGTPDAPAYADIALTRGVTAHRPFVGDNVLPSTAWHAEFEDVNNDTLVDLYVTKGNVDAMREAAADDPNNLMLGQSDGTFVEAASEAGILSMARARGAAVVDLNLDGWLDIVEVTRREPVRVWQNLGIHHNPTEPGAQAHWVQLQLHQPDSNHRAVGAWVEVTADGTTMRKELTIGGGHAGGQLGWIHFGLGRATSADVDIVWPDGQRSGPIALEANTFAIIERGNDIARYWQPGTALNGGS